MVLDFLPKKGLRVAPLGKHSKRKRVLWQPAKLVVDESVTEEEGQRVGNYSLGEQLGSGGFGSVVVATGPTGEKVAIKVQSRNSPENADWCTRVNEMESSLLSTHSHHCPNIIGFRTTLSARHNIYMVLERATVDLASLMRKHRNIRAWAISDQPDFRQQVMRGILTAIQYLHERGIAHCDLKPDNVLLVTDALDENLDFVPGKRVEASDVRLCDFGISRTSKNYNCEEADTSTGSTNGGWNKNHDIPVTKVRGTPDWFAPDCRELPYEARRADIWGVGAILLDICPLDVWAMRHWRFRTMVTNQSMRSKTGQKSFARECCIESEEEGKLLYELLYLKLFTRKAEKRVTANRALQHPWFQYHAKSSNTLVTRIKRFGSKLCASAV